MAQGGASPAAPPVNVTVDQLGDLLPDSFPGEDHQCAETFFKNFCLWVELHQRQFHNNNLRVSAIKYCLSKSAADWSQERLREAIRPNNPVPLPANLDALEQLFFQKFRVAKTRKQLRDELSILKYEPGVAPVHIKNNFLSIAQKLQMPNDEIIEKFLRLLPPQVRQFVATRQMQNLDQIVESVIQYQTLVECDEMVSAFKNVSFATYSAQCKMCDQAHDTTECPSIKALVEAEVLSHETMRSGNTSSYDDRNSSSRHMHEYGGGWNNQYPQNRGQSGYHTPRYDHGNGPLRAYHTTQADNYTNPNLPFLAQGVDSKHMSPAMPNLRDRSQIQNFTLTTPAGDTFQLVPQDYYVPRMISLVK